MRREFRSNYRSGTSRRTPSRRRAAPRTSSRSSIVEGGRAALVTKKQFLDSIVFRSPSPWGRCVGRGPRARLARVERTRSVPTPPAHSRRRCTRSSWPPRPLREARPSPSGRHGRSSAKTSRGYSCARLVREALRPRTSASAFLGGIPGRTTSEATRTPTDTSTKSSGLHGATVDQSMAPRVRVEPSWRSRRGGTG